MAATHGAPESAHASLFVASEDVVGAPVAKGPDFSKGQPELFSLLDSYSNMGFQATSLGQAIDIINQMRKWRLSDEPQDPNSDPIPEDVRQNTRCHIMLGFTSNLVSSGLREVIRFLCQHNYISGICTTAGGIEEDLIKCLGPTYIAPGGRFDVDGATLRKKGLNRIGNLIVPNNNYCKFEDWIMPIFDQLVVEQKEQGKIWSPSTLIERLGASIDHEESYLYWAAKNKIPVFCPALTDGSLGDMLWTHSYKTETPLIVDLVSDIRRLNDLSLSVKKAGMIILGGGVCKHQIANSMLFRNGADYAVYVNTGQEFDGSDSGARPDEAVSWGKIRAGAQHVKVFADATLIFPMLVAATWAKDHPRPEEPKNTSA